MLDSIAGQVAARTCGELAPICWMEAHPGTGSWAQTAGTVAAVWVAVWAATEPTRIQLRERRAARRGRGDKLAWLTESALITIRAASPLGPGYYLVGTDLLRSIESLADDVSSINATRDEGDEGLEHYASGVVLGISIFIEQVSDIMDVAPEVFEAKGYAAFDGVKSLISEDVYDFDRLISNIEWARDGLRAATRSPLENLWERLKRRLPGRKPD